MVEDLEALRIELRQMVEDHWRSLIRLAGVNPQTVAEEVFRFDAIAEQLALSHPPDQATHYRNTLQELRAEYAEWERTDPASLRRSLNVMGKSSEVTTAWIANLETPPTIDLKPQLNEFWRGILAAGTLGPKAIEIRWAQFLKKVQNQVSDRPTGEQDGIVTRLVLWNAEYIDLARTNRDALEARLGLSSPLQRMPHRNNMVVETAVRATIWNGIGALFRAFR